MAQSKSYVIISCYFDINSLFWKAQVQSNLEGKRRPSNVSFCPWFTTKER